MGHKARVCAHKVFQKRFCEIVFDYIQEVSIGLKRQTMVMKNVREHFCCKNLLFQFILGTI